VSARIIVRAKEDAMPEERAEGRVTIMKAVAMLLSNLGTRTPMKLGTVDYASTTPPKGYRCATCGARGVKLWRPLSVFLFSVTLTCCDCSGKEEKVDVTSIDVDGRLGDDGDQIGGLGPAVPTPEGDTFWGYTSVPNAGVRWWRCLPLHSTDKPRVLPPAAPEIPKPDYTDRWEEWQKTTAFVVEATSFESLELWSAWHKPVAGEGSRYQRESDPANAPWEQLNPGCVVTVGHLAKMPVCVSLSWSRVHGQLVLFWEATSMVVDNRLVEAWLTKHVPAYKDGRHTNAINFHNCVHELKRRESAQACGTVSQESA
jgi:hypothetical protein